MALDPVTTILVNDLDRDLRTQIVARREAMLREKRFLEEREDPSLSSVKAIGWTDERFEALCGLNSFYQLVLGPLASSARERMGLLGRDIPILYGETLRFDAERAARLRSAHADFFETIADLPDAVGLLTAPHFSDLVFRLARATGGEIRG